MTYEDKASYDSMPPCIHTCLPLPLCHTHKCNEVKAYGDTHIPIGMHVTWLIHMCDWVRDICVPIHTCGLPFSQATWFICVTWLMHMCDMVHSYVGHDSFVCVPWLVYMCDMTHLYVWHDSFICVTWLIRMRDMTYSHVWHDSFTWVPYPTVGNAATHTSYTTMVTHEWVTSHIGLSHVTRMNESCHTYEWVMSHIWMSHVTHMNESCHTYEWVMSHVWISHVTRMNESCHTYKWVMSHI